MVTAGKASKTYFLSHFEKKFLFRRWRRMGKKKKTKNKPHGQNTKQLEQIISNI